LPNVDERKKLFELYTKSIVLDKTILDNKTETINKLSKLTAGLSGADIANIVNQSIINSLGYVESESVAVSKTESVAVSNIESVAVTNTNTESDQLKCVKMNHIMKAIDEVIVGFEKRERLMSLEEKKIVSYHEAGHCLLSYMLKNCLNPIKVSIIPVGDSALGFSQSEPDDRKLWKKSELMDRLCVIYGGRIAEEITFGSITTGAYDDIEKATKLANSMVTKYGFFDDVGLISFDESNKNISKQSQIIIDNKIKEILNDAYLRGKDILLKNQESLNNIANYLFENEVIYGTDLEKLAPGLENSI
jgi:ATP-dependent Zn protease